MGNEISQEDIDDATDFLKRSVERLKKRTPLLELLELIHYDLFYKICGCRLDGSVCYYKQCMKSNISSFCSSIKDENIDTVYDIYHSLSEYKPDIKIITMMFNYVNSKTKINTFYHNMEYKFIHKCICSRPSISCVKKYIATDTMKKFITKPLNKGLVIDRLGAIPMVLVTKCSTYIKKSFEEYEETILKILGNYIIDELSSIILSY